MRHGKLVCAREQPERLVEHFAWLVEAACEEFDVIPDMILIGGAFKDRETVAARQRIAWIMRLETTASFPVVGRLFGMDHSSILLMCRRETAKLEQEESDDG